MFVVEELNLANDVADRLIFRTYVIPEEPEQHLDFLELDTHDPPRELSVGVDLLAKLIDISRVAILVQLKELLMEQLGVLAIFLLFLRWDAEEIVFRSVPWHLILCCRRHFPLLERHDVLNDQADKLQVLLAVNSQVELLREPLQVQVLKASLQQPVAQQKVGDQLDPFL